MATIQHGVLTSTATTADQVISSFTPTGSTSWKCTTVAGWLTTASATEANLGAVSLQQGGVAKAELRLQNTDTSRTVGLVVIPWGDGVVFTGSEVLRWIVTPAAVTSMRWAATFYGQG